MPGKRKTQKRRQKLVNGIPDGISESSGSAGSAGSVGSSASSGFLHKHKQHPGKHHEPHRHPETPGHSGFSWSRITLWSVLASLVAGLIAYVANDPKSRDVLHRAKSSIDIPGIDVDMSFLNLPDFSDFDFDFMSQFWDDLELPPGLKFLMMKSSKTGEYFEDSDSTDKPSGKNLRETTDSFAVGQFLRNTRNVSADHPVLLVPGVVTTGLESWGLIGTSECPATTQYRKRLWGSMYMLKSMFLDKACWLRHVMLDDKTGLDPPEFKLRAASGFEAADFFVPGYWVWNKVVENLSAIGYDPNTMITAAYDWRLAYLDLEIRDGYFSKFKSQIEVFKQLTGRKVVLTGHSMGAQVVFYFMKWVEAEGELFGNGGKHWVNDHVEAFVDISGCLLGTPKAVVALLSGEMKDTIQLNSLAVYGLEKFFSRRERADMLRSFGGISSMYPKGGDVIWGDLDSAPDDAYMTNKTRGMITGGADDGDGDGSKEGPDHVSYGTFIRFRESVGPHSARNWTMAESIDYVLNNATSASYAARINNRFSNGLARSAAELRENEKDHRKWTNPLEVALPDAPDMKIYCFYGYGNPTERSYYYKEEENPEAAGLNVTMEFGTGNTVVFSDGDGTVSLLTHSMCHKWKQPGNIYNPSNIPVKIVEIKHEPGRFDLRGGAKTAEHVDILGSAYLNELVLLVASGNGDSIEERIETPLVHWVDQMDF